MDIVIKLETTQAMEEEADFWRVRGYDKMADCIASPKVIDTSEAYLLS